ncbi:hypothetical protein E8E11_005735 [Didymella keratinophila]|nr:hypothetical protein E8E11_005735 [Didymella keratinophila]
MSATTSILSIELIDPAEGSESTPTSPICIDIAIQHPCWFRGEVIAAGVPLQPLKETTPAPFGYLTTEGTEIVLPRSETIDWSFLLNLIDVIVGKHCSGGIFEIENRLHQDLRAFFLEDEGRPYRITRLLEEHFNKHGLDVKELATPEAVSRKRRDTVTERIDIIEPSPFIAPSPASTESPILPAGWLAITRPKQPQRPVDIEVGFSHGKSAREEWDGKWNGKSKNC